MDGHPEWHVDIELFGDDEVIYARATLRTQHATLVGRGAAKHCAGVRTDARMGDSAAIGAALQDLGRQLCGFSTRPRKRMPRPDSPRRNTHDQHARRG